MTHVELFALMQHMINQALDLDNSCEEGEHTELFLVPRHYWPSVYESMVKDNFVSEELKFQINLSSKLLFLGKYEVFFVEVDDIALVVGTKYVWEKDKE